MLRQQPERDGWFWKTAAEWQRETGLSRREQDSARRRLRALGLLEEQRRGMPAKRWFRLDLAALGAAAGPRLPGQVAAVGRGMTLTSREVWASPSCTGAACMT